MSFSETPGSNTGDQPKPKSANPPVPLQSMEKQGKKATSMEAAHTAMLQDEQSKAAVTLDAELAGLDASEIAQKKKRERALPVDRMHPGNGKFPPGRNRR